MLNHLSILRFASEIERQFQVSYYARVRPTLRLVSGVLAATLALYLLMGWNRFAAFIGVFSTPASPLSSACSARPIRRAFRRRAKTIRRCCLLRFARRSR